MVYSQLKEDLCAACKFKYGTYQVSFKSSADVSHEVLGLHPLQHSLPMKPFLSYSGRTTGTSKLFATVELPFACCPRLFLGPVTPPPPQPRVIGSHPLPCCRLSHLFVWVAISPVRNSKTWSRSQQQILSHLRYPTRTQPPIPASIISRERTLVPSTPAFKRPLRLPPNSAKQQLLQSRQCPPIRVKTPSLWLPCGRWTRQ